MEICIKIRDPVSTKRAPVDKKLIWALSLNMRPDNFSQFKMTFFQDIYFHGIGNDSRGLLCVTQDYFHDLKNLKMYVI